MTSPFDLTIKEQGTTVLVTLHGELDISTAARLEEDLRRIEADGPALLVIDLSGLEFMDSTGLRLLIAAAGPPATPRLAPRRIVCGGHQGGAGR